MKEAEEDEEEEEEALSLCDLPVTLINDKDQDKARKQDPLFSETQGEEEEEQDFDFNSWGGLFSKEPEMCAADEVFFQGQILPLRHSFSSEPSSLTKGPQSDHGNKQQFKFNRCESMSESMDHGSLSEFRSNSSSRSSSVRSQNSSISSTSSSTTTTTTPRVSKPKIRNQFHTIPSPKPQLRQSSSVPRQAISQGRKSSSAWEFFRLGVVPAPEIGLQDLKVRNSANRNCVSRNSSSSSNNSTSNANTTTKSSAKMGDKGTHHGDKGNHHVFKQFVGKGGGLLSGCSCSIETVAQLDMIKGGGTNNNNNNKSANKTESATHAMKGKVVELKKQRHNNRQKQAKKVMSRRRTFEWLKELHASHPDEEALLSNP